MAHQFWNDRTGGGSYVVERGISAQNGVIY